MLASADQPAEAFLFRRFFRNEDGNFAIIFGLLLIPLLGLVGAGVDYAGMNNAKAKIQAAADIALLSAAKDADNSTQFYRLAENYLGANLDNLQVTSYAKADAKKVSLSINSRYETAFLGIVGMPHLDINVEAEVAVNKFGSGSAQNQSPSRTAVDNEIDTLEKQLMRQVANFPPRQQERIRQRIKEQMALLRKHVSDKAPASQIRLSK